MNKGRAASHAAHLLTLVLLQPYNEPDTRNHELSCIDKESTSEKVKNLSVQNEKAREEEKQKQEKKFSSP